ncbi:hypothetical protein LEP1GSC071_0834, partial [Leptospira santarosai str. JET]
KELISGKIGLGIGLSLSQKPGEIAVSIAKSASQDLKT